MFYYLTMINSDSLPTIAFNFFQRHKVKSADINKVYLELFEL